MFRMVLFVCILLSLPAHAQRWTVEARPHETKPYRLLYAANDSLACLQWANAYQQAQAGKGFLQIRREKAGKGYRFTLGERHTWENLRRGNAPLRSEGKNAPFSLQHIEAYKQKVLRYAENNGYPFAQIRLDSLQMRANRWRAIWRYEPRLFVTFDSVAVVGKLKINPRFLKYYLRLQEGQPFSQAKLDGIKTRLQRLPYLRLKGAPAVRFLRDKAFVVLPIEQIKANQIDGIIGILPNENQRGQVLLTGELNAQLYNLFAQGHSLKIQWQRLQTASQRLEINTQFLSLFRSPWQLHLDFKLLKQDSSFVNQNWEAKLGYATQGNSEFFAHVLQHRSNLGNANYLYESKTLPNISETRWQAYGVGYKTTRLDDIFFPRRGVQASFAIYTGKKEILKNPFLADTLYRGIELNSPQTLTKIDFAAYLPLGRGAGKLGIQGAYLANGYLFMNELLPIGGLTSLRGHNQNAFFVSQYLISTLEYRVPLEAGSYLFVFYDQAIWRRDTVGEKQEDTPAGIGIGANLSLKAGIFSLAYALGKDKEQSFAFNRAKIHFGVVSKF